MTAENFNKMALIDNILIKEEFQIAKCTSVFVLNVECY